MRRTLVVIVIVAIVAGVVAAAPRQWSLAGAAAPTAEGELCSQDQINRGNADIQELPPEKAGVVLPTGMEDHALYVVVVTLPKDTCVAYHAHQGPISLVVFQGAIEYGVRPVNDAGTLRVYTGVDNSVPDLIEEPEYNTFVPLATRSWATQNEAAAYTYRNVADTPAVVALAGFVSAMNVAIPTAEPALTAAPGYALSIPVVGIDIASPVSGAVEGGLIPGCDGGCRKR